MLGLTLVVSAPLAAQELRVGARVGLNVTNADFEGAVVQETSARAGFRAGIHLSALISRVVELQTGGLISSKGFDGSGGLGGRVSVDQLYFEIPMLIAVRIPGRISPHFVTGPILGLEMSCRLTAEAPVPVTDESCDDVTGGLRTKGADFGILFGGGIEVDIGRVKLLGDVQYNLGLTDISEFSDNVDEIKNRAWYLTAGVMWPIGDVSETAIE